MKYAEYALILGAVAVVAIAFIVRCRKELQAAFEAGIQVLRAARVNILQERKGQAMAEFAPMTLLVILLLFGMTFVASYAYRSASTD